VGCHQAHQHKCNGVTGEKGWKEAKKKNLKERWLSGIMVKQLAKFDEKHEHTYLRGSMNDKQDKP
jgi:hypothetical protein